MEHHQGKSNLFPKLDLYEKMSVIRSDLFRQQHAIGISCWCDITGISNYINVIAWEIYHLIPKRSNCQVREQKSSEKEKDKYISLVILELTSLLCVALRVMQKTLGNTICSAKPPSKVAWNRFAKIAVLFFFLRFSFAVQTFLKSLWIQSNHLS